MEDREAVRAKKRVAEGWAKEATAMSDDEEWCYNCAGHGHLGDVSATKMPKIKAQAHV